MLKKQKYLSEFADIGSGQDISNEQLEILQTFICDLYGLKDDRVNLLIYYMSSPRQGEPEAKSIPACFERLQLQTRRKPCQSYVWRKCLVAKAEVETPIKMVGS